MRGRKAGVIKDLEQYDFDQLSKTKGNSRERKRYLAFTHIRDGKTFTEAASRRFKSEVHKIDKKRIGR
jgi:hypothetical protein